MKFTTDLIYRFSRALPTSAVAPDEVEVEVPPVLLPVVGLSGPLKNLTTVIVTENQRESFAFGATRTHAASTAQGSQTLCTFGSGFWRLVVFFDHRADFTGLVDAVGGQLRMVDPDANVITFLASSPITNVVVMREFRIELVFDRDGFTLDLLLGATGVGQTQFAGGRGFGLRLN